MRLNWRRYVGRKVRLHTAESSIEGVLVDASRELLVLRAAEIPSQDGPVPVDGEAVVERISLVFGQVL